MSIVSLLENVDLWAVWINDLVADLNYLKTLLCPAELDRLATISNSSRYQEFICSRGGLRLLLAQYLERSPQKITIAYHAHGKPFIPDSNWQFNVSHSCGLIIYGLTLDHPIGVDIEWINRTCNYQKISDRYFGQVSDKGEFWQLWTTKEAQGKALGTGLKARISAPLQVSSWRIFEHYMLGVAVAMTPPKVLIAG